MTLSRARVRLMVGQPAAQTTNWNAPYRALEIQGSALNASQAFHLKVGPPVALYDDIVVCT